jgi:threonine/homoserine/homoserine lactone efflux protein
MGLLAVCLVAILFGFVGSVPLAGPVALLVFSRGVDGRYSQARRIGYGAAVAEGAYAFFAFWGFATFLARYPLVLPISHGVTAALLFALGVHFVRFKEKEQGAVSSDRHSGGGAKGGPFVLGFSISAFNPTLLATWSAVTTFLYSKQIVRMTSLMAVPFGVCAGLGIALWATIFVSLLRRFKDHFPQAAVRWVVRSMGVVLLGVALWSLASLARYLADPSARQVAKEVAAVVNVDADHVEN